MNICKSLLALMFMLITGHFTIGQEKEREVIKDLREDWLHYEQGSDEYIPLIQPDNKEISAIHFHLALPEYKNYQLYLELPPQSSIWVNQKLVKILQDQVTNWSIDSLIDSWGSQHIFVSIYKQGLAPSQIETLVVYERSIDKVSDDFSIIDRLMRQTGDFYRDFFVLGFIIILIIYTVIINIYSKSFRTFYDISRTLSINIREEYTFKGRALNNTNTIIILAHSLLIGYLTMLVIGFEPEIQLLSVENLIDALWQWVLFSGMVFLVFLAKYWMIKIIGGLFDLRELVNRHYLEYLRMSKIFFALLFVILSFFYLGFEVDIEENQRIFINFAIVFLLIRAIMLFFKFMRSSSFKNFYLFAYLCSTEFLPLVIGLKFILNIYNL
ncbi:MAG: DUF4271 domain-containing protein [Cyclobacteriaceae bacterium]